MSESLIARPLAPLHAGLSAAQIAILAVYGAALWFLAAMIVRCAGPAGAFEGDNMLVTYALVIPGTIPAVMLGQRLARLSRGQTLGGIAVVTAAAALLDGIALAWFPRLYGSDPAVVTAGSAVILWGVGVGLVLGLIMSGRDR